MEIWKDIPNHSDYQCSNLGRFKSKARKVKFTTKTGGSAYRNKKEKILKQVLNKARGYNYIALGASAKGVSHRYLAKTFLEDFSEELDVDHINGDRTDNRIANLRMCTRKENINNPITKVYCLTRKRDASGRFI